MHAHECSSLFMQISSKDHNSAVMRVQRFVYVKYRAKIVHAKSIRTHKEHSVTHSIFTLPANCPTLSKAALIYHLC